ncbi:hypothetical protein GGS26DRAFT_592372 [Hypomontagnella submonticulosa]|nr:hypothetical protein GGS26DRAFT_592372 [Hypomontagnella submonticulosa]
MSPSQEDLEEDTLWYCCNCGYGGMSLQLNTSCVEVLCGHKKCRYCCAEYTRSRSASLYPGGIASKEALRSNHKARQGTHQQLISRAASPLRVIASATTGDSPSLGHSPTKEPLKAIPKPTTAQTDSGHIDTEPIGLLHPEIGGSNEAFEDGECTPRSCDFDTIEPINLISDISDTENGAHPANCILEPVRHEDLLTYPFDPSPNSYFLHTCEGSPDFLPYDGHPEVEHLPEVGHGPGIIEAFLKSLDEIGTCEIQLPDASHNHIYPLEPHTSAFGTEISENHQHPTLWLNPPSDASPESHLPSLSYNESFSPFPIQFSGASHQLPDMELSATDQNGAAPLPGPGPQHLTGGNCWQASKKRKFSQEDGEVVHGDRACEACRLKMGRDESMSLACLFYKRDPGHHQNCMQKKFNNISALGQHLSKEHAVREPTDGTEKLATISKSRSGPNTKWFWTWRKLFGEREAPPKCPYTHPIQDMTNYILTQSLKDFHTKETKLDINEIREIVSRWIASNLEPPNDGH